MTPYATKADVDTLYGPRVLEVIADRDRDGQVDEASVTRAMTEATGEIESYISKRYTIPLNPVPPLIRRVCVDIAVYHLAGVTGATMTNEIRARYERAIGLLRDISGGRAGLGAYDPGNGDPPKQTPTFNHFSEAVRG